MTVKIICDSSADLNLSGDKTLYDKYDVKWVPMQVMFGTEAYKEMIDLKTSEFYEKLHTTKEHPTTSQCTQHDVLQAFEEYGDKYDEIISMHLSSKLSGAYTSAMMAKKMYEKSNPDGAKIHLYDTLFASTPFGLVVIKAAQLAKKGLSAEKILEEVEIWRKKDISYFFSVQDLKWLFQGGRLSKAKYYIGSFLSKNPILHIVDGVIESHSSETGLDKAVDKMMELHLDYHNTEQANLTLHWMHADFKEETEKYHKRLLEKYPGIKSGTIFNMGCAISAHTGPGTLCSIVTKNFDY